MIHICNALLLTGQARTLSEESCTPKSAISACSNCKITKIPYAGKVSVNLNENRYGFVCGGLLSISDGYSNSVGAKGEGWSTQAPSADLTVEWTWSAMKPPYFSGPEFFMPPAISCSESVTIFDPVDVVR